MRILRNLSVGKKLLFSNILYVIPVVVLMVLMIRSKDKDIIFAKFEKYGIEYHRQVEILFEKVSHHKLVAQRFLHGDVASKPELDIIQSQVDQASDSVERLDKKLGNVLQVTEEGL